SRLLADFGKKTFAIVAVELRTSGRSVGSESGSIRDENVVRPVPVVVEDRGPGTRALENEVLFFFASESVGDGQTRFGGDVDEVGRVAFGKKQEDRYNSAD